MKVRSWLFSKPVNGFWMVTLVCGHIVKVDTQPTRDKRYRCKVCK